MKTFLLNALITWLLFLPIPIINGLLREKWYKSIIGEMVSHQVGAVVISAIFLLYAYVFLNGKVLMLTSRQLWQIGLFWLVLTLMFEFGLGLFAGRSWVGSVSKGKEDWRNLVSP